MRDEVSWPLDDTKSYARDIRMFHIGRTSGVINATGEDFNAVAGVGMQVLVAEGYAYVQCGTAERGGLIYGNKQEQIITIDPADALLDRYDAIVIGYDRTLNNCTMYVKKGESSSKPTKYEPIRNTDKFELVIKNVFVKHGISAITNDLIADEILDEKYCGLAVDSLAKIPTQQYDNQIKSWQEKSKKEFIAWYETIKGTLDGDVGAKLSAKVAELELKIEKQDTKIQKLNDRIKVDYGKPSGGLNGDIYFEVDES